MPEQRYEPAVCNIGRDERRQRWRFGSVALAAAAAYTTWVLATGGSLELLAGTLVLSFGGFLGLLQARMNFCVAYAATGEYDLSGSGGGAGTIDDEARRRQDRVRALEIGVYAAGLAVLATVLAWTAHLALYAF